MSWFTAPTSGPTLQQRWADARPRVEGVHLDSAACSRPSFATMDAVTDHMLLEATRGGYVAEALVAGAVDQLRADLAALTGFEAAQVQLGQSAGDLMPLLLTALGLPRGTRVGLAPSEYQRTRGTTLFLGWDERPLPVDPLGRVDVEALPGWLLRERPAVVVLPGVASHRGIAQPLVEVGTLLRAAGVLFVHDAAQTLGQVDCADVPCDAWVGTARKWLAGPRGVGMMASRVPLLPVPPALRPEEQPASVHRFESSEAHVAGRVGLAVAVRQYVELGPAEIRAGLHTQAGRLRRALDGTQGWQVVEPYDEPSAITTLRPPAGVDVAATVARLRGRGVVTTGALPDRALAESGLPVLRVSPHLDGDEGDVAALSALL